MERRRLGLYLAAGAVAMLAAAQFAVLSHAITPVGPKPLSASLLGTSQQHMLDKGSLKARVLARSRGRVAVTVTSPGSAGKVTITKPRTIRFARPRARILQLPLTPAGAAAIARCSPQSLTLKVAGGKARGVNVADIDRDSAACHALGGGSGGSGGSGGGGGGGEIPAPQPYTGAPIPTSNSDRCDFLDPAVCLQPFPNDYFTVADSTTDTGRRVNLKRASMPPANPVAGDRRSTRASGTATTASAPGNMIVTKVPGLDNQQAFDNTGACRSPTWRATPTPTSRSS